MNVLGLSAFYHDSAAALVCNGQLTAAAQEERFTRVKHDRRIPENAISSIVKQVGLQLSDIDLVVFYESPSRKFDRLINSVVAPGVNREHFISILKHWISSRSDPMSDIISTLSRLEPKIAWNKRLLFSRHHLSHAASAFYPSPYRDAAILTVDGVGEWTTSGLFAGHNNSITPLSETQFPHSLGLLYSAFTHYLGFKVNSGEYKVMGLAPYGEPRYVSAILDNMVDLAADGSCRLNLAYFNFASEQKMITERFEQLLGYPCRRAEEPLIRFHMDIASSIQKICEQSMVGMARHARTVTGLPHLCMAGGVALNCVANGLIHRLGIFDGLWIQPAAGDAGGAVGAAYLGARHVGDPIRSHLETVLGGDAMRGGFLGPAFQDADIAVRLDNAGARFVKHDTDVAIVEKVAQLLADNKVVGWFQGRMEFGPRALGNRSILANPKHDRMQSILNLKIKYREGFRPFAPAILDNACEKYFDLDVFSPYMLLVAPLRQEHRIDTGEPDDGTLNGRLMRKRSRLQAVTHVDYSARIQTVNEVDNPIFRNLIETFGRLAGDPILINTSFNVRGEPIVCTPEDAFRCFMGTEMDALAIGRHLLYKSEQSEFLREDYRSKYAPD